MPLILITTKHNFNVEIFYALSYEKYGVLALKVLIMHA